MARKFGYGAILGWKEFPFDDGGKSDKLLIVLGAQAGKNYLAILTTSQSHGRKAIPGCHAEDGYFFIGAGSHEFLKDTWLELYRPQEMSAATVLKGNLSGDIWVVANLRQQIANEIRNCLKRSPDTTQHQLSLLS